MFIKGNTYACRSIKDKGAAAPQCHVLWSDWCAHAYDFIFSVDVTVREIVIDPYVCSILNDLERVTPARLSAVFLDLPPAADSCALLVVIRAKLLLVSMLILWRPKSYPESTSAPCRICEVSQR